MKKLVLSMIVALAGALSVNAATQCPNCTANSGDKKECCKAQAKKCVGDSAKACCKAKAQKCCKGDSLKAQKLNCPKVKGDSLKSKLKCAKGKLNEGALSDSVAKKAAGCCSKVVK